ncbi:conserved protein of unknown function [Candidatus Methylomirabilis oxygeniifera]|uniref:Uncharacterized protein n=1 Tax=Methylomirabilis oxygeniifera TaxID=671143 RepID=D5ML37_METO1|nr:conserved protein of unknown function [Candidatus Methylomirabilis oxyfera]
MNGRQWCTCHGIVAFFLLTLWGYVC